MLLRDFGIRQVAQLLGKSDDEAKYANRSLMRMLVFAGHY